MPEQVVRRRDHSAINVAALVSSLREEAGEDLSLPSESCIFRTPAILRRHNEAAYTPNAFSIGPFHHHSPNLQATGKIKVRYLRSLMNRARGDGGDQDPWNRCANKIRDIAGTARQFYGCDIDMSNNEFAKMLLLDGCFIVELLLKEPEAAAASIEAEDPIPTMACMLQHLKHDLILMENQIPWPVLVCVYKEIAPNANSSTLIQQTLKFFGNIFSSSGAKVETSLFDNIQIKHILDLLRISLILPIGGEILLTDTTTNNGTGWQPFPTTKALEEAGITIRRVNTSSILDIRFQNGVLEMPSLLVQETTETIFRNLISFEQCYPKCPPRVTCYAILLDNLINTREDMDILCERGIVDNWLNPDDATKFFSMLYHDTFVKRFYYQALCEGVNDYRRRLLPRWRAYFMHNYLVKPWASVSLAAALLLLVLTFLQTLFSILSYNPHEKK